MFGSHPFDRALFAADLFRAVAGIVLTAMAAPLTVSLLLFGPLVVYYVTAPFILVGSYVVGLSISSAAALINAAAVSLLARLRADALPVSILSGGLAGLSALSSVGQGRSGTTPEASSTPAYILLAFGATGALMGALYWLIAIRPQRHRRLARESGSARDFDQAARDALQRKRDRRIPWDGRAPPY